MASESAWRAYWLREGLLALSPMPAPWELERVTSEFRSVLSLCMPSEHFQAGYDPRLLKGIAEVLCVPTPPQQAPTLDDALRALLWWFDAPKPVLVHSRRGCGRAVMMATLLLSATELRPPLHTLTEVVRTRGCGLESLPQKTVVYAAYYLARSLKVKEMKSILEALRNPAALEYSCILGAHLSALGVEVDLKRIAERLVGLRESLDSVGEAVVLLAEGLARYLDYLIAGLSASRRDNQIVVRIVVWGPRASHPRVALREAERVSRACKEFETESHEIASECSRMLGLKVRLVVERWPLTEIPDPTLL